MIPACVGGHIDVVAEARRLYALKVKVVLHLIT